MLAEISICGACNGIGSVYASSGYAAVPGGGERVACAQCLRGFQFSQISPLDVLRGMLISLRFDKSLHEPLLDAIVAATETRMAKGAPTP